MKPKKSEKPIIELDCMIVPVDFLGRLKRKQYAERFIFQFSSRESALEFVGMNSDSILSNSSLRIVDFC